MNASDGTEIKIVTVAIPILSGKRPFLRAIRIPVGTPIA